MNGMKPMIVCAVLLISCALSMACTVDGDCASGNCRGGTCKNARVGLTNCAVNCATLPGGNIQVPPLCGIDEDKCGGWHSYCGLCGDDCCDNFDANGEFKPMYCKNVWGARFCEYVGH